MAEQHSAHNLRIFGSVAKGTDRADSDVDLLADLDKDVSLFDYVGLIQALE
ncbi:nucleotidyltransferase family protein [cf. Phormidesmis sp. LEGE 11477]|uniref:nucleotidyltransferase family protein n=1 Tax=cf. Phormidesmis sp. LEGE 11477 TaxID=1828680 RepID=UPI00351CDD69